MRRLALAFLTLLAAPALAQQPPAPVGQWRCVVNAPAQSIDLQMQVNPDRTLFGRGTIIYNGTSAIYQVQGPGDWTALPPDQYVPHWNFKFRMAPQNHAIFSWFAGPRGGGDGMLYNVFQNPQTGGVTETACERIG